MHPLARKAKRKMIAEGTWPYKMESRMKDKERVETLFQSLEEINERLDKAKDLIKVQGLDGNWNSGPYMQGMYNGMEVILAVIEDREPVFKDAPEKWGKE